jgi:protein-S-isoprenylcysteine O-methyltransferase Ste14
VGFLLITTAYLIKLRREERLLSEQFGEEYANFRKESWALLPGIW